MASDLFGDVTAVEHEWETAYDRDAYLQLLDTSSDHRLLDPDTRERLFDEVGRVIDAAGGVLPGHLRRRAVSRAPRLVDGRTRVAAARRFVAGRPARDRPRRRPSARRAGVLRPRRRPDRLGGRSEAEAHDCAAPARQCADASGRQPPRRPLRRRLDSTLVGTRRRDRPRCAMPGPSTSRRSTCWRRSTAQYRDLRPAGAVLEITALRWRGWSAAETASGIERWAPRRRR